MRDLAAPDLYFVVAFQKLAAHRASPQAGKSLGVGQGLAAATGAGPGSWTGIRPHTNTDMAAGRDGT